MKEVIAKKNKVLFIGLFAATFSLLASWGLQQPNPLFKMDTMESLVISGVLSAVTVVLATLVGLGLASHRD